MSGSDFLLKEYEFCYDQLRYYDTRHSNTLKHLITLTSSMGAALFGIYKLMGTLNYAFYTIQALLSLVVFVGSILFYLLMLQNRLYFVLIAKQINSLRLYFCERNPDFNNQLWVNTNISPFKLFSVHSFQMLGAVVVSSLFAASGFYALYPLLGYVPNLKWTLLFFIGVVAFLIVSGSFFLLIQGRKKISKIGKTEGSNEVVEEVQNEVIE
ncbi:MAG: hypothetical protein JRJ77_17155 [Deltaproteobacteria bacterium]|nr:hypothetical protein [Deltaproteobacteria bacterium]